MLEKTFSYTSYIYKQRHYHKVEHNPSISKQHHETLIIDHATLWVTFYLFISACRGQLVY